MRRNTKNGGIFTKNRLLPLLLVACLLCGLCACGDSGDSAPASGNLNDNPTASIPEDNPSETTDPADTQPNYEGPIQTEPQESDSGSTEPAKLNGLIIMTVVNETAGTHLITLSCVDPEAGSTREVSHFSFGYLGDNLYPTANSLDANFGEGYYTTRREWFDDDLDRMAANHRDMASGECHAGWFDETGEFFDVTEALGLEAKSDFDSPTMHCAIRFSEDGYFVYKSLVESGSGTHWEFYRVPLSNLTAEAIETGISMPGAGETYAKGDLRFSDYDSSSEKFLLNTTDKISYLCEAGGENQQTYVPGTNRLSWNGVFSPDGASVAFMSMPKNGGAVDIYTMPLAGGDPVKVTTDFTFAEQLDCEKGYYVGGAPCSMLIGWE